MKSKDEIKQWLLENALREDNFIDLENIDFGNVISLNFNGIKANYIFNKKQNANLIDNRFQKAYEINNEFQEAEYIHNKRQKSYLISNHLQIAEIISNCEQKASKINNDNQKIVTPYEDMTKEELIKLLQERDKE